MIARVVATLNCLAPGQTFLGVSAGEAHEYTATGLWPAHKTRQMQLVEAIELSRNLWFGEVVSVLHLVKSSQPKWMAMAKRRRHQWRRADIATLFLRPTPSLYGTRRITQSRPTDVRTQVF
ncbi:MAG TPA: hypothetical protein VK603_05470 [Candidatus Saccharimonadales bacterium]|nr:hypothetical protein [Candidatus Saccharimonadales bacterium]